VNVYSRIVSSIAHAITWIGVVVISAMMVLTCTDVVLRYFGYPIRGAYDITRVLGNVIFSLPIAYSYMKGYQVSVDSVFRRTPRIVSAMVDSLICLFSMAITLMISWRAIYLGYDLYVQGRVTDTIPIPLWPFISIMVLGFFVYGLVLLAGHLKKMKSEEIELGRE
jgi:TRAP-type C4-dicarboxylate transport system permease small subunit